MTHVDHKRPDALGVTVVAIVLLKIFFLVLAWGSVTLLPGLFQENNYWRNFHWPSDQPPTTATTLATWDAQHYLYLATEGYAPGRRSITFFPLLPWLIRTLSTVPGVSPLAAGLLLSNLLSLAAFVLLLQLVDQRHEGDGETTLLLTLAFPGALFFTFPYTEGLFLFLAVATLFAVARERWLLASAASFAIALTRPNGVLIGVPLLWAAAAAWRRDRRLSPRALVALAAPGVGFAAYLLFMRAATGDAFAGFTMQDAYNAGRSLGNFLHPWSALRDFVDVRVIHGALYSLLDRVVFVLIAALLVPLWRLDRLLFWYTLPMALVGPLSGGFMSYTRFAAVLFPCYLVAARGLSKDSRRPLLWLTLAVWYGVQMVLLLRHVSFRWAG